MPIPNVEFRRERRVAFEMPATVEFGPGKGMRIDNSVTVDLSESGVRLRLTGEIHPGEIVDLYLNPRPERCRVVWTSPAGAADEKFVGLQFISPLPDVRRRDTPYSSRFEPVQ